MMHLGKRGVLAFIVGLISHLLQSGKKEEKKKNKTRKETKQNICPVVTSLPFKTNQREMTETSSFKRLNGSHPLAHKS